MPFQISSGDWQDISADIPATGPLGIFRLYLPAQNAPVELDHVELKGIEKVGLLILVLLRNPSILNLNPKASHPL